MINRKRMFLGYIAIIYSITLLFVLISNLTSYQNDQWRFFYQFTQQSNIIVLIWLILFGISSFKKMPYEKIIRNKTLMISITVYISITYFIVALVLDPIYLGKFNPVSSGSELWLHHLTPILMWIMFFLVPSVGTSNNKKTLLSLIYPLIFVVVNLIVGSNVTYANGDKAYAYGFISPDSYGGNYLVFLIVILVLLAVFSLFSLGLLKLKTHIDNTIEQ